MTMTWRYLRFPTRQPIVTLGGLSYRSKPILSFTVIGPSRTKVTDGLADTGPMTPSCRSRSPSTSAWI
jgi:hypothetical protein